ncbi:hypothetical protein D0T51_02715 [Parabacteroides sp. 52]|uniref:glycosyltransferase n=1 Tax=Parabacteroides sp. 52 TaxID=2302940 RepID=UPI0013D3B0DF|nr:glycosyltransferase [Parabacteroides sp. 52]NDV54646.1 hypothetical protein [Parabacteroides sp. 52]
MKKVLIICDLFPPAFGPRMGYLTKYIRAYGWEPIVLTETVKDESAFSFLTDICPVTRINFYTAKGKYLRKLQWLFLFLLDFFFDYKDFRMVQKAHKMYKKQPFDLVLCSTFRTFPLKAARKVAQKYNLPFVVDLRDIIEQYSGNEFISHDISSWGNLGRSFTKYFRQKNLQTRNEVLTTAAHVTTISPWHVEVLQAFNRNVSLIYNGYDPELFYPEQPVTRHFVITYTGRILSTEMRDPGLFMQALSILLKNKKLSPCDCKVHWYVDAASWDIIYKEAEKEDILSYMVFKGYVPANQIPHVLNNSSVLLLLTNKSDQKGPKGTMTTKFFESLAVEKPILCVRSDESYLAAAIDETNAGLAATKVEEVSAFLMHYYEEWKVQGYTSSPVNREAIQQYSRKNQAKEFAILFNQLIDNRKNN